MTPPIGSLIAPLAANCSQGRIYHRRDWDCMVVYLILVTLFRHICTGLRYISDA